MTPGTKKGPEAMNSTKPLPSTREALQDRLSAEWPQVIKETNEPAHLTGDEPATWYHCHDGTGKRIFSAVWIAGAYTMHAARGEQRHTLEAARAYHSTVAALDSLGYPLKYLDGSQDPPTWEDVEYIADVMESHAFTLAEYIPAWKNQK